MKKIFVLFFVFITTAHFLFAQTGDLFVKKNDKGLYLDHKVAAKENFYSIGRLYHVPAKEIAAYNNLDMSKGLNLAQMIRIPLTAVNFSQTVNKGTPVYFKAGEKDGLPKVSSAINNVSPENLRRWNNLSGDHVNAGNKMIVGFLISNEMPSVAIAEKKEPVVKTVKTEPQPVIKKSEPKTEVTSPQKEPVVKTEKPVKTETPPVTIKKEPKTKENLPKKQVVAEKSTPASIKAEVKPVNTDQGYFKSSFDQQAKISPPSKNETVTSGIFKTASGWQDAKYYLLMDGIQPGKIVKITNPDNNRAVYAKVLGEMSGIHQNEGLNIRISNSAASVLEIADLDKFVVKVNW
jgi:LysM domain